MQRGERWMIAGEPQLEMPEMEGLDLGDIEALLIADDVGRLPILANGPDGKERVVGILTRTDLLRQRAYYGSLHYHNKGFSNSLADRQAWLKLRNKLKQFDIN